MRENINKVSQRGERLDSLQDKTDNLAVSAQGFRRGANRVRKQMWWKDMRIRICIIIGIILLLVVIIVPAGKLSSLRMPKNHRLTAPSSRRNHETLNHYRSQKVVEVTERESGRGRAWCESGIVFITVPLLQNSDDKIS